MIEVTMDNVVNLEKVIKEAKKGNKEKQIQAKYILDAIAKQIGSLGNVLTPEQILNAKIKKVEETNSTLKGMDKKITKTKKVVKYYLMPEKERLDIIKQIIIKSKKGSKREEFRQIFVLGEEELKTAGILDDKGKLNPSNPYVKKLVPKSEKPKKKKA